MALDYAKLGFKCGIEIHQRLASHEKLFCACATQNESEESDGSLERRQRAVAGELGAVDAAAVHEQLRNRKFVYATYPSFSCDVDEDQEPPHALNQDALDAALQVALMLKSDVVDEAQVMRKAVLDGSNTGGFQRTAVIALDGKLDTSKGTVSIPTVSIEEEASAIQGERSGEVLYRLDRLGIPLVEIGTAPEIASPEHCREVAERLGMILRATGRVQRGIGTIRQDVNVSIRDGARVEIKGAQDLGRLSALVENEVLRQAALVKIRGELEKRGAKECALEAVDVSRAFAGTQSRLLRKSLDRKEALIAFGLARFEGLLGAELCEGRRLGSELSDYAKAQGVGGIIHGDEDMKKYGISEGEVKALREAAGAGAGDAWVLVAGPEPAARNAAAAAFGRAMQALRGVPEETRKVVNDVQTAYMRPLPGGARLYPETDLPPVRVSRARIEKLESVLPEMPEETLAWLKKTLNSDLAEKMARSQRLPLFRRALDEVKGADATLVAATLEETLTNLKREGVKVELAGDDKLLEIFAAYFSLRLFAKAAMPEIIRGAVETPGESAAGVVERLGLRRMTAEEIRAAVRAEAKETGDKGMLLKRVMAKHRLRAEGAEMAKAIDSLG
ncbi:MAG: Glu-tRNA(Gln) amidotransferase subunit GatE [Candidatus ainarchaeum sp.]|nr:Glu-tRNA(Gln) amidotransferase subunit GatE [Candidatus ainarchaeum sp.]